MQFRVSGDWLNILIFSANIYIQLGEGSDTCQNHVQDVKIMYKISKSVLISLISNYWNQLNVWALLSDVWVCSKNKQYPEK